VKRALAIYVLLLLSNLLLAQNRNGFSQSMRKFTSSRQYKSMAITPQDTIRILALMVEFQTDADYQTTGDGKLQSIQRQSSSSIRRRTIHCISKTRFNLLQIISAKCRMESVLSQALCTVTANV